MPQIVTINESVIRGAAPNLLQQKGVLISLGATNVTIGTVALLTQASDLTALLTPATASTGTAAVTTSGSNSATSGGTAVATPAATTTASNAEAVSELKAMVASWFANSSAGVWVLELGAVTDITTPLTTFISENPYAYYGYTFPRKAAANDSKLAGLFANQGGNNSRVYFFLCGQEEDNASLIADSPKSVWLGTDAPGTSATQEHLAAAVMAQFLSARPSPVNQLAPMNFRFLTGITAWPEAGNGPTFEEMKGKNISFAGTSNEGGIKGTILFWGNFLNGDPMSQWYGADWAAINLELQLANLIIEASQPGIRPLVYDQNGIDRLEARAEQVLKGGTADGCIVAYSLSTTSFAAYITANPTDYTAGVYNGLAATIATPRGILSLTFNLTVDFSGQTIVAAAQSTADTEA